MLWALARGRALGRAVALRGGRVGAKTSIGRRCTVDRPWRVKLGRRVVLESDVYLKIVSETAYLTLGDFVFVGRGVVFDVIVNVSVGAHTLIAPHCFITDHNHGVAAETRVNQQACRSEATSIGADVWLGAGVVVLAGVTIGDGAIVGANSVVTHDVAPMSIVAGAPARFIRQRSDEERQAGAFDSMSRDKLSA